MQRSSATDQPRSGEGSSIGSLDPADRAARSDAPVFTVVDGPDGAPSAAALAGLARIDAAALAAAAKAVDLADVPDDHQGLVDAARAANPTSRCPVDYRAMQRSAQERAANRTKADLIARRVLRIRDQPVAVPSSVAYRSFRRSMMISATRCLLTYVFFPFVAPALGFATGAGPVLGILIGSIAMVCDVYTIRRFHSIDHKYRWPVTAVAAGIIGLLLVLLVQDVAHLVT